MCNKRPGSRCSKHARERLEGKEKKKLSSEKRYAEDAIAYKKALSEMKKNSDDPKLMRRLPNLKKKWQTSKNDYEAKKEDWIRAQMEYDGTNEGQAKLLTQLNSFDKEKGNPKVYSEIMTRMNRGKSDNAWRHNFNALQRDKKNSGQTIKQRRGNFLSLKDRTGNEEIVHDSDYLSVA